jgi:hypothetical protein
MFQNVTIYKIRNIIGLSFHSSSSSGSGGSSSISNIGSGGVRNMLSAFMGYVQEIWQNQRGKKKQLTTLDNKIIFIFVT